MDTRQLQLLHFCLFLGISLAALLGNGFIISAIACGHHLHTPMFFFLLNLALSDLGSICTTVPKGQEFVWPGRGRQEAELSAKEGASEVGQLGDDDSLQGKRHRAWTP
ncbi:hypothetical protein IHE44_0000505 [Lamprotornis superbus]|uniref:G-protein coupled receptors family 1 profile domain-containing protein n=1 Tax=Lamprotornis superbus TaxID=245042 RepID=A0A835NU30_9PASS|nr:hypothetical protein IHE44_0000505 [Lamprotornis superbus]